MINSEKFPELLMICRLNAIEKVLIELGYEAQLNTYFNGFVDEIIKKED